MNKIVKSIIVLVGASTLLIGCNRSPEKMAEKITGKIASKLDFNEIQTAKLEKIKLAVLEIHKSKKESKGKNKEKFKAMILGEQLIAADAKSLMSEHRSKFEGNFDKVFPLIQDLHATLSVEQKQKLVKFMDKFHSKKGRGHHW
ncbi:MAG: hypothetical protein HOO06_15815 [Bdellovibrionaceae bacterium]|jgi:hypothetical protein|nr:hypothetical protein [Pseudobdellovibrionaceae bacterium]